MSKIIEKNVLEVLLGSRLRVKLLKFLFRNFPSSVGLHELADKIQEEPEAVRRELMTLREIKLVRKRA